MERYLTAQRVLIVKTLLQANVQRKIRCNEVVGISNCCERRQIDFPGLTVTLSSARTSCSSIRQERFCPSDFTVKAKAVVTNFVNSQNGWEFSHCLRCAFSLFVKCFNNKNLLSS